MKHCKTSPFLVVVILLSQIVYSNTLFSQTITGQILDAESKAPIEYVNIGIPHKQVGTVCNNKGFYTFNVKKGLLKDSLYFSCVGYEDIGFLLSDFSKQQNHDVHLKKNTYDINEVVIKPKYIEYKTLGLPFPPRQEIKHFIGCGKVLGDETGTYIKNNRKAFLEKLNILFANCNCDSIFYRLNIYEVHGKIDSDHLGRGRSVTLRYKTVNNLANICREPIYINLSREDLENEVELDLKPYNLSVEGDFLIVLEHVKDFLDPKKDNRIYIATHSSGKNFQRSTRSQWITMNNTPCINVDAQVELKRIPGKKKKAALLVAAKQKVVLDSIKRVETKLKPPASSVRKLEPTIITRPISNGTTASYVKIKQIALQDSVTIIDFEVDHIAGASITIDSTTYIQDSKGGDKLYIIGSEGIRLNQRQITPENGKQLYSLYFPPLDKKTKQIDYMENEWQIYDIELVRISRIGNIPKEFQGYWYKTDGGNVPAFAFFDNKAICKGEVWPKAKRYFRKRPSEKELTAPSRCRLNISIKKAYKILQLKAKKDNVSIKYHFGKKELYSREKPNKSQFISESTHVIDEPIFSPDTAIYKGYIKGYHPKLGIKNGIIEVGNVITGEASSYIININKDGTFYAKIPMLYPQKVYCDPFRIFGDVYLEPGKTTIQVIDLTPAFELHTKGSVPVIKSVFMGETAQVNQDLQILGSIDLFNYDKVMKNILGQSAKEYKAYCMDVMNLELNALDSLAKEQPLSAKAILIKQKQIQFSAYSNVLSYHINKKNAYKKKNQVSKGQAEVPFEHEALPAEYYQSLNLNPLNDYKSLAVGFPYELLMNRITFSELMRKETNLKKRDSLLFNVFGLEEGLVYELMLSQDMHLKISSAQKPYNEEEIELIKSEITDTFIVNYLLAQSAAREIENQELFAKRSTKTGYAINETPNVEAEKVFDAIISKYKGKVIYVDFWATWCAPCRKGIKDIRPLKEKLKDEDVVFLYITNESSPEDTWNLLIPDIKGEHYRLSKDEWNYLKAKFNISGIPHHLLIDQQQGVVSNNHIDPKHDILELLKLQAANMLE